ncbi:BnaC02g41340D [Brassica napus]|uniref:BnaC02g41340D protein n=1 Tax=Brassica napus TaxID=3708 RepID=A0A078I548_BRANA|nr:BnaC02g41340D [Brassica napus]
MDLLRCLLERLSFVDFHRAKMVCSIWYLCSKQALGPKAGSPMLIVSQEEGSYRLYNPEEDRVYKAKSNYRFLGSSGKWFLVVDSRSDLYVINVFSNERFIIIEHETRRVTTSFCGVLTHVRIYDFARKGMSVTVRFQHGSVYRPEA